MIHRTLVFGCLLAAIVGSGCVSQQQYDQLQVAYRRSQEQVVELQGRLAEVNQRIADIQSGGDQQESTIATLMAERDRLTDQLNSWASKYKDLEDRVRNMGGPSGPVLTPQMDKALRDFAAAHDDLVTYDADLGMIKFKSDLTFGSGSADLTDTAKTTLNTLAGLLKGAAAAEYDVKIVGHTDNVPIRRPATRAKRATNWHLSVHRAISVRDALEASGIAADRTTVSGYGEYWPIVSNTRKGAAANRRVEIFLVAARPKDMLTPTPDVEGAAAGTTR